MSQMKKTPSEHCWTKKEERFLARFDSPAAIQSFLDSIPYNTDDVVRSPRLVIRKKKAHCLDGALFAAAALERLGYPPLLLDLVAVRDDDHVLAIYKKDGKWGAVAKSNTTLLRYRDPVFTSLRELVMSYWPFYFNTENEMSLLRWGGPLDLKNVKDKKGADWRISEEDMDFVGNLLNKTVHHDILTRGTLKTLPKVQKPVVDACFLGAIPEGLFVPKKRKALTKHRD